MKMSICCSPELNGGLRRRRMVLVATAVKAEVVRTRNSTRLK
uniref:Uncharacterized protein n=1 Tax=Arundo donax TaxID=35708 RepID=A0A0A8Z602_ARUDO